MNKTKIEWCDYTINPIKGLCRNDCWYCYAKRMYKRFKWDEHVRQDFSVFVDVANLKKPSRIFVGSMHDIFGFWIPYHWINGIISYCRDNFPQHTFIFLTKNPSRYSEFVFPDNCWLGASIESDDKIGRLYDLSKNVGNITFASFEPLLSDFPSLDLKDYYEMFIMLDWIIIGGLTPKPAHKEEWVNRIIHESCTNNDIPVFLKDNLKYPEIIKEYPMVKQ